MNKLMENLARRHERLKGRSRHQILAVFILSTIGIVLGANLSTMRPSQTNPGKGGPVYETIKIKDSSLSVEIAATPEQMQKGLMYRKELDQGSGMLFIFQSSGLHSFWMKNTLIPLDILWIDENWLIADIKENVLPCKTSLCPSYIPEVKAKYVLEVNAGWVSKNEISIGDRVQHSLRMN